VEARIAIVQRGNLLKFSQCTNVASMKMDDVGEPVPLKSLLLATGAHHLVEASPFDPVWGIGFKAEVALSVSRAQWGQISAWQGVDAREGRVKSNGMKVVVRSHVRLYLAILKQSRKSGHSSRTLCSTCEQR